jgi:phage terminase small subunit
MAGVKGRSGGARQGAGRPKKASQEAPEAAPKPKNSNKSSRTKQDPLDFLMAVVNDPLASPALRVRAAIAAAQYKHTKRHDGGKKDEVGDKAKKAGSGRFSPAKPPKLVVNNR